MAQSVIVVGPSIREAAARIAGVVARTPLVPFGPGWESGSGWERVGRQPAGSELGAREVASHVEVAPVLPADAHRRIDLRLKLECLQVTGSFKARGAWNQVSQLTPAERAAGVVTTSSGNHGKALAWAAERAGVRAAIVMPADAYPNKIQACRDYGAEVVLAPTRAAAEEECRKRVERGATLIHPFDAERTVQGAGTVGLEIAEDWPEVEVVVVPAGGGGLVTGISLAIRQVLGEAVAVVAVEPEGAPTLTLGLKAGRPVPLERIATKIQGLCPPSAGAINVATCRKTGVRTVVLGDGEIFEGQRRLVRAGWVVEPAGAAAAAAVFSERLPEDLLAGRSAERPLRVAAVVSGGNPDPDQLAEVAAERG